VIRQVLKSSNVMLLSVSGTAFKVDQPWVGSPVAADNLGTIGGNAYCHHRVLVRMLRKIDGYITFVAPEKIPMCIIQEGVVVSAADSDIFSIGGDIDSVMACPAVGITYGNAAVPQQFSFSVVGV